MKIRTIFTFLLFCACSRNSNHPIALIPYPESLSKNEGTFSTLSGIDISSDTAYADLSSYLAASIGKRTTVKIVPGSQAKISFKKITGDNVLRREGYILSIMEDKITISANERAGFFYGIQTLLQLMPADSTGSIPYLTIFDMPHYQWRGFMLDVARQYYPKEVVLKLIDALAMYKINVLQLHLSDDQGWRIEIDALPALTRTGARANPAFGDHSSGFYTKAEMREIIQYAAFRNITIVPEIDMPGHSRAAITSYPELSCFGGPGKFVNMNPRDSLPFYDPVCPGKETTFEFYEKVINEIAELFPSEYIHIGGDETSKSCWKTCRHCQERIRKENLKGVNDLQNYFAGRVQKMIEAKGKKAIGWDELYQTGAAESFATMAWREEQWGVEALAAGHKVVLAPCQYYYFNYNQGYDHERRYSVLAPIHQVYQHPLPLLDPARLMGIQACHWGGDDSTGTKMFEAIFPRMIAFAEKAWTEKTIPYDDFADRLIDHYTSLDRMQIPYYIAHPEGLSDDFCLTDEYTVELKAPFRNAKIHYTTDGSEPTTASAVYSEPFKVPAGTTIKAKTILPDGRSSITVTGSSRKTQLRPAVEGMEDLSPGLKVQVLKGNIKKLQDRNTMVTMMDTIMNRIEYPGGYLKKDFGLIFTGFINIPADGVYSFHLTSCDGSNLFIDGDTAVSDDFRHPRLSIMKRTALAKGIHKFELDYFYSSIFEKHLLLEITGPGMKRQEIPAEMLLHE